jgi:hypothetical protein
LSKTDPERERNEPKFTADWLRTAQVINLLTLRPHPTFVPHAIIKQTVHDRIQDYALGPEPWSAKAFRTEPDIDDITRVGFDVGEVALARPASLSADRSARSKG